MEETVRKRDYHFLRIATAVIVLFIVYTHFYPKFMIGDRYVNDIIIGLGRFAVLVLFMTSGYFLYSKDGHSEAKIKSKMLRMLILILILKAFYLVMDLIFYSMDYLTMNDVIEAFLHLSNKTESHAFYVTPLWFIIMLFISYVVWYLLYRYKVNFDKPLPIFVAIVILDLLFAEVFQLFGISTILGVSTEQIGWAFYLLTGISFFAFGYYLHEHKEKIDPMLSNGLLLAMTLVGLFVSLLEVLAVNNSNIYFGTLFVAFGLFLLTFRVPEDRLRNPVLEYMGRNLTLWMYGLIPVLTYSFNEIIFAGFKDNFMFYNGAVPFIGLIVDVILAFVIFKLIGRMNTIGHKSSNVSV